MAPRKKTRNNKIDKNRDETPRPPATKPCQRCGEDIIIPKTCKHGKKLVNCQGTGCITAHVDEHNATCTPLSAPTRPRITTGMSGGWATSINVPQTIATGQDEEPLMTASRIQRLSLNTTMEEHAPPAARRAETPATMTPEHRQAMGALTVQLNAALKIRGGKPVRYLNGIPFTEWWIQMETGPIELVDEWIGKLKDVVDKMKSVEGIGYDDEESEGDEEACHTPEDDNEWVSVEQPKTLL